MRVLNYERPSARLRDSMGERVWALVVGCMVLVVGNVIVREAVEVAGWHGAGMTNWTLVGELAFRVAVQIGACWVAGRLVDDRPMGHALALGGIWGAWVAVVAVFFAGRVRRVGIGPPMWWLVALAASTLPCAWMGGWLAGRRRSVA